MELLYGFMTADRNWMLRGDARCSLLSDQMSLFALRKLCQLTGVVKLTPIMSL